MATSLTWNLIDYAGGKQYRGITVPNTVTTDAARAFANVVKGFSDASLQSVSVKQSDYVLPLPPASARGTTNIERSGLVVIGHVPTGQRFGVTIDAIRQEYIDANGTAQAMLTEACTSAILSAFASMSGLNSADLRVVSSTAN